MIDKLVLKNFQSHKDTSLEFTDGVNVIIGPSDSGKTSIIRALRWIAWNRPLGDAFRSNWGGGTLAQLHFDDGVSIERYEADNDRHYKLANPNDEFGSGNELEFKAFGTEVPEEVQEALNLSEINLQEQMDAPFLLSDNPGQVSRHFNKVANIDKIDSSLKAVESWVRSIGQDISAAEAEIQRYEEKLEEFEYLDKMEQDIEVLEQLESRRNSVVQKSNKLSNLIDKLGDIEKEIRRESKLLPAREAVDNLLQLHKERAEVREKYKSLKSLVGKIIGIDKELRQDKKLVEAEGSATSLLNLYNNKTQARKRFTELKNLVLSIADLNDEIKNGKQHLSELEENWHEVAPETCPLCEGTGKLVGG